MTTGNNKKGPIYDPGTCRCCGASKKCRLLNADYEFNGQKEVYSDLFVECFGLVLSHMDGEHTDRLICAMCVTRLREACSFRRQVLSCEERLLNSRIHIHDGNLPYGPPPMEIKTEVEIKQEVSSEDDFYCMSDDDIEIVEPVTTPSRNPIQESKSISKISRENKKGDKLKNELLHRIQQMKNRLKFLQSDKSSKTTSTMVNSSSEKFVDTDSLVFQNNLMIIENSYVCPFQTAYTLYYCPYCSQEFSDPNKLRQHNLKHDPKEFRYANTKKPTYLDIQRIDCRQCDVKISDMNSFKQHIKFKHGIKLNDVKDEFLKFKLTDGLISCTECDVSSMFFHNLKRHMAVHFGSYVCEVCGEHYFGKRALDDHCRNIHKNVEKYACHECGKVFKKKSALAMHVSCVHKKEPVFQCSKCEVSLFSYKDRRRHLLEVHGVARKHICDYCRKEFNNRSNLREHTRTVHLRVYKHKCNLCHRGFAQAQRLAEHVSNVHRNDKACQFFCDICGNSYPRLSLLKVHIKSHGSNAN